MPDSVVKRPSNVTASREITPPVEPVYSIRAAFFASTVARTAGFNTVDVAALSPESLFAMDVLMFIGGGSAPLRTGSDSLLTSYLVVPDTEVPGIDTAHGRVEFLQLVGITLAEFDWLADDANGGTATDRAQELATRLAAGDPNLVTDLGRTTSLV